MFFKAKDYVTAGNAVCGLASVVCVIEGSLRYAALFILVSWIFDTLDGVVARLTGQFNKFGGEFDTMCDHLTYGICPGFVVYGMYRDWMPGEGYVPVVLAAALGFVLPMAATIRHAWRTVKPIKVDGFWIGLPRPVSAFVIVSFFNSSVFGVFDEFGFAFGIVLVFGLAVGNLRAFPYMSHHAHVWKWWVGPVLWSVPVTLSITLILGPLWGLFGEAILPPETFFDLFFFWLFGYSLVQWFGIPKADWDRVMHAIAEWKALPEPK